MPLPGDGAWLLQEPPRNGQRASLRRKIPDSPDTPANARFEGVAVTLGQIAENLTLPEANNGKERSAGSANAPAAFPSPLKPELISPHPDQTLRKNSPPGPDTGKHTKHKRRRRHRRKMPSKDPLKGLAPHERAKLKAQAAAQESPPQPTAPSTDIVQKLESLAGVKVHQSRLVPYSETTASEPRSPKAAVITYPSPAVTGDMKGNGKGKERVKWPKVASPTDSAVAQASHVNDAPVATGWAARPVVAQPVESWTPAPTGNGLVRDSAANAGSGARHSGISQRGRGGKQPRESRWPKKIPKGASNRREITWSSEGDRETELDSNRASSGWGTRKKRAQGDAALGDWGGGFAPPPVDWDSRPGFHDDRTEERVCKWVADTYQVLETIEQPELMEIFGDYTFNAPDAEQNALDSHLQGDAAPRYWVPLRIGELSAKDFWEDLMTSETPEPVDAEDCNSAIPWWDLYQASSWPFLKHYEQPAIKGVDPDETQAERLARENDTGNLSVTENKRATEKAKKEAAADRRRLLEEKKKQIMKRKGDEARLNRIKPDAERFFLRAARAEDMVQVRDIYNKYIDSTVVVPETCHRTETDMERRRHNIKLDKMHFIVACERGQVIKGRKKRNTEDIVLADKILGFAYVNDWYDLKSIYRFTLDLELFVHQEYYNKGIGSCLLDKMLGLLDPFYLERGGYDTQGEELDGVGPSRVCKQIMIHYRYEADKKDKLRRVAGWLEQWPAFKKVGDLEGVGYKFDKKSVLSS